MVKKLPKGLDQQGRHPEAAHCATEVGADDDGLDAVGRIVVWTVAVVTFVAVVSFFVGYFA